MTLKNDTKKDIEGGTNVAIALKAGHKVVFPGTFKAEVVMRKARTRQNSIRGEEIKNPAKKTIKVKMTDKVLQNGKN